jgi:hypothetical protein
MASANLDLVRSLYTAWGRGDFSSAEWADPEIAFVIVDGPARGSWAGLAGMAAGCRSWLSAWEDLRIEVDEYRDQTTSVSSCFPRDSRGARRADWRRGAYDRRPRPCSMCAVGR